MAATRIEICDIDRVRKIRMMCQMVHMETYVHKEWNHSDNYLNALQCTGRQIMGYIFNG